MKPEISVIIPVYNIEKYITRCLESIISQTFPKWECILIDDGSKDNSLKICQQYADKDSRFVVIHQENSGVSVARNKGIENAHGNYIAFIDGDDTIEPDSFEVMYNTALNFNADIVQGKFNFIGDKKDGRNNINQFIPEGPYIIDSNTIFPWWFGMCWTRLYSIDLIRENNIKFPSEISLCEDTVFSYICLASSKKTYVINKKFYNYYSRSDSALGEINLQKLDERIKACELLSSWFELNKNNQNIHNINNSIIDMKYRTKKCFLFTFKKIDCNKFLNTFPELNEYIETSTSKKIRLLYYLCLHNCYFVAKLIIRLFFFYKGKKLR